MMKRTEAREEAFKLLYSLQIMNEKNVEEQIQNIIKNKQCITYNIKRISLLLHPSPDQLERSDALLLFAPRKELAGNNPILYTLYPGGEGGRGRLSLVLPAALAEQAEPNCDGEQLAAALFVQGAVTLEALLAEIPC